MDGIRYEMKIPISIKSDLDGYRKLIDIHHQLKNCAFENIKLDFTETQWLDANLFALFGAFLYELKSFNTVTFVNLSIDLKKVMVRSGFIRNDKTQVSETYKTAIQYKKFKTDEEQLFCNYIEKELLKRTELPQMSSLLKKKILQKLIEVFDNAHQHSQCDFVFTSGQFFPTKNKLSFTIVDIGKTIQENVEVFLKQKICATDAIEWAVDDGNTTRPKSQGIPGGLGLTLIRSFLKMNKGKVQILSGCGLWEQKTNGNVFKSEVEVPLNGTVVNLEFNLNDNSSYKLRLEPEIKF